MQNQMSPVRSKLGLWQVVHGTTSLFRYEGEIVTSPIRVEHVGSVPARRVGSVPPSIWAWTPIGPYYRPNVVHVTMWAILCYRSVVSDLPSQVGPSGGMWAEWVRSAFCVVWSSGPSKIGPRWASSLGSDVGYEQDPSKRLVAGTLAGGPPAATVSRDVNLCPTWKQRPHRHLLLPMVRCCRKPSSSPLDPS
ncbi:hypothetical protein PIB30_038643 [Stylosanthes scabra]|uniref:Uncharacterized protein n=1 Tax=Stylosanthes scabra TaxID=79078 RepID=A0ABU6WFB6_9FABA|nr:hypothetical protein [Stylosanthes scabra]